MSSFKKGLSRSFISALGFQAKQSASWWRDILSDPGLLIAVRDEYLNVYWQGQSLFLISFKGGMLRATTHPKYLLDPDLSGQVDCDLEGRTFGPSPSSAIITKYEGPETLSKMKRAAALFAGEEKRGVHHIVKANDNVVDVEFAMSAKDIDAVEKNIPRIDIVAFDQKEADVEIVFWEAKHFVNPELRAKAGGKAKVLGQIDGYKSTIKHYGEALIHAYKIVASNLLAIAVMSEGQREVSPLISAVATGSKQLVLSDPARVGLVLYGYDGDHKATDSIWSAHLSALEAGIGKQNIRAKGEARGLKL